jgi:hypothetical protein
MNRILDSRPLLLALFALAAVLELIPVWSFTYLPTQDGPAHLYNASIMAGGDAWPAATRYFEVRFPVAGNLLSHVILSSLIPVLGAQTAEKCLITFIIFLYPLSTWLLLRAFGSQTPEFALWAFLFAKTSLFAMGFWNFCLASALLFLLIAAFLWLGDRPRPGPLAAVAALSGLLYFSHSIPWSFALIGAALAWLARLLERHGLRLLQALPTELRQTLPSALALAWPGAIFIYYLATAERLRAGTAEQSLAEKAWLLYSGSFLSGWSGPDHPARHLVMITAALLGLLAIGLRLRPHLRWKTSDALLALAGVFALALLFSPSSLGSAGFLGGRFAILAALAGFLWLGCQPWPAWIRPLPVAVCLLASFLFCTSSFTTVRNWQRPLAEMAAFGALIPPGSVVLPAQANRHNPAPYDPLLHAAGYWDSKDFVYLRNYEAYTPHFPVRFRPDFSPSRVLGGLIDLQGAPARFSISDYEQQRRGRIDSVLIYGIDPATILSRLPQSRWDPAGDFHFITSSQPRGHAYLYRRRSSPAETSAAP